MIRYYMKSGAFDDAQFLDIYISEIDLIAILGG